MYSIKRILALCLSLLVLMMNCACADVDFLVHSNGWQLEDTALEVQLSAAVDVHMPFDEDRLAMLTPILDQLSLRLITGEDCGLVTIAFDRQELLVLQYQDDTLRLSSMPDVAYTAQTDAMGLLLGSGATVDGGYEALGLSPDGESIISDGRTLLNAIPPHFPQN